MIEGKVSVIIPVYNEKRFLDDCISSIEKQTYRNLQIILVDDGSIEEIGMKCDEYAGRDNRIYVLHKQNEGLSAARLSGYECAVGNWIMFVDDDDILPLYAIEVLIREVQESVDIVAGKRVDLKNVNEFENSNLNHHSEIYSGVSVCEKIGGDNQNKIITPLWGKIYRKKFLSKLDLYQYRETCPTIFFEDVLMTPILYSKARYIALVDIIVYIHREVETSISRSGSLSPFYYEQIESGNILLKYCKSNELRKLYAYELKIYFGCILRLWCLIDMQKINGADAEKYKASITRYYRKYLKDYIFVGDDMCIRKWIFSLFGLSKKLWGKVVYNLYFKKRYYGRLS